MQTLMKTENLLTVALKTAVFSHVADFKELYTMSYSIKKKTQKIRRHVLLTASYCMGHHIRI